MIVLAPYICYIFGILCSASSKGNVLVYFFLAFILNNDKKKSVFGNDYQ